MLHHSAIPNIIEQPNSLFNMKFVKISTGEIITCENVRCTSSRFRPRTYNIEFTNKEKRKVRHVSIIELNGVKIYH